jgi:hypothetical protein
MFRLPGSVLALFARLAALPPRLFRGNPVPRVAIFFIPVPDALPFAHATTYSFMLGEDERLAGLRVQPTPETAPVPNDIFSGGQMFVSLKFWQAKAAFADFRAEFEAVDNVMRAVVPANVLSEPVGERNGEAMRLLPESYRTIVEAVTPFLADDPDEKDPLRIQSDAFDRSVEAINRLVRAYRVSSDGLIAEVTRERLPFSVLFLTRAMTGGHWAGPVLMLVHFNLPGDVSPDVLSDEELERLNAHLQLVQTGHPLFPYGERALDSRLALVREGNTKTALILAQIAIESLLDTVLSLILWEEGMSPEEAASKVFAGGFMTRLRNQFAARLGGSWDVKHPGPTHDLVNDLVRVRGRVVHADYMPTRDETWQAIQAATRMDNFIRDRLADRRNRYPKTTILFLGDEGLRSRGLWGGKIERFADDNAADIPHEWIASYSMWRSDVDGFLLGT